MSARAIAAMRGVERGGRWQRIFGCFCGSSRSTGTRPLRRQQAPHEYVQVAEHKGGKAVGPCSSPDPGSVPYSSEGFEPSTPAS